MLCNFFPPSIILFSEYQEFVHGVKLLMALILQVGAMKAQRREEERRGGEQNEMT